MDGKIKLSIRAAKLVETISEKYKKCKENILIVGISGAPGTGKSTISEMIVDELNKNGIYTQYCPMDGFHFTNKKLTEMQLSNVKGKMKTFDVDYLNSCIKRLKSKDIPFYWPTYCREIHDPVIKGILISDKTKIFIVEGNYIYLKYNGWDRINKSFDLKIFLTATEDVIKFRLLKRHLAGGKSYDVAVEKVENVDIPNAHEILKSQCEADIVVDMND
jgi:putative kinase